MSANIREEIKKFLAYFQIPFDNKENTKKLATKLKNSAKTNWQTLQQMSLSAYFIQEFADKLIREPIRKEAEKPIKQCLTNFRVGQMVYCVLDNYAGFPKWIKILAIDENWIILSSGKQVDPKTNRLRNVSGSPKAEGQIWASKEDFHRQRELTDRFNMIKDFITEVPAWSIKLDNDSLDKIEQLLGIC